jgi:hypothetical protein
MVSWGSFDLPAMPEESTCCAAFKSFAKDATVAVTTKSPAIPSLHVGDTRHARNPYAVGSIASVYVYIYI